MVQLETTKNWIPFPKLLTIEYQLKARLRRGGAIDIGSVTPQRTGYCSVIDGPKNLNVMDPIEIRPTTPVSVVRMKVQSHAPVTPSPLCTRVIGLLASPPLVGQMVFYLVFSVNGLHPVVGYRKLFSTLPNRHQGVVACKGWRRHPN